MVAHGVFHVGYSKFLVWDNPQGHGFCIGCGAFGVWNILVHAISKHVEEAPNPGLAPAATAKVGGCIGHAEIKIGVFPIIPAFLACKLYNIL